MKHLGGLSAVHLIKCCKGVFTEHRLPRRIISDADVNFISEMFRELCKKFKMHHVVSSYKHWRNGQVDTGISSSRDP